jgi:hypothetical protein
MDQNRLVATNNNNNNNQPNKKETAIPSHPKSEPRKSQTQNEARVKRVTDSVAGALTPKTTGKGRTDSTGVGRQLARRLTSRVKTQCTSAFSTTIRRILRGKKTSTETDLQQTRFPWTRYSMDYLYLDAL